MGPQVTIYEISWGAAGLLFALGGARALIHAAKRRGHETGGVGLRLLPVVAAALALVGARLHALLGAPQALGAAVVDGTFWLLAATARQRIGGGLLLAGAFLLWVGPRLGGRRLRGLEILDAIVPVAGLSIAVGRIGCFLGGCCFGVPTEMPWAVQYGPGSAAYWNHVAQSLIADDGGSSLSVHALSVYLGGAAAAAAIVAFLAARFVDRPGAATSAFVVCMTSSRLVLEPLRETRFLQTVPAQTELDAGLLVVALGFACWLSRGRPALSVSPMR
ncbi:MAG: prolipoprotein diacylglyceryl transferase [Candidatus Binatia bacterium]|nr:prolipoprotein diacylglyceryl transferase [Candidatus Binatia bacterium]